MDRRPRQYRPSLEGLETRDPPSALQVAKAPSQGRRSSAVGSGSPIPAVTGARGRAVPTPSWVNPNLLQGLAQSLYAPVTTTTPITVGTQVFPPGTYSVPRPTPAEVRRVTIWAEFVGTYYVGPPRFSNQAATIHIYSNGKDVTSNQFFSGRGQVLLFPPADPTATPTTNDPVAGQIAGLVSLYPSNVLQGSSQLYLDATNLPGVASNDPTALDHGLPSRLKVILDAGTTAGMYATPSYATTPPRQTAAATGRALPLVGGSGGAVAFTQGAGLLDLTYFPARHRRAGTSQSGTVVVRFQGLINVTGVENALYKGIN